VIVPTSSVAAVRLRGSIEVAYEDQMSAPDLVPGRCGLRAGIATAGARCFGLRGAFGHVELRRLADADDEQEAVQRRGRQAIARPRSRSRRVPNRATRRNELKRVARADAEYRADMQAGVTLGLVWHPLIAKSGRSPPAPPVRCALVAETCSRPTSEVPSAGSEASSGRWAHKRSLPESAQSGSEPVSHERSAQRTRHHAGALNIAG
jgi:hypothetical protein